MEYIYWVSVLIFVLTTLGVVGLAMLNKKDGTEA